MEFALPEIGEGVYEAELVRWVAAPGSAVKMGQTLLEVMTDKATMEVPSPFAGTIDSLLREPGQTIKVGDPILTYTPAGAAQQAPSPTAAPVAAKARQANGPAAPPPPRGTPAAVVAAPSVRHMARKMGIDLAALRGSGPGGRVLIDDLTRAIQPAPPDGQKPKREPGFDVGRPGTRMKLAGLRRKIAEHMALSKRTIPHYSYVDECDLSALVALRSSLKDAYQKAGVKLTFLPFLVKAVVAALKEVPLVNSSLDEQAGEIVLHDRYDIGIAVATPGGLIVPVVRGADKKDIGSIARDIERLSNEARTGKSRLEDLKGGTFTISSFGSVGGLIATPVINHPEVGILALGKVVKRPVYDDAGQVRPADMAYLSFSFDHRVVDGAVGAVFGNVVVKQLKNPALLLLPEKL
jgi:pyruvate dehydrogenase E2 component (dihydrolipoamide acetyltransferase)/2-oxoisovalerate dehydrogenase E2 component (dihydrolipoyl transacylase)